MEKNLQCIKQSRIVIKYHILLVLDLNIDIENKFLSVFERRLVVFVSRVTSLRDRSLSVFYKCICVFVFYSVTKFVTRSPTELSWPGSK